MNGYLLDTNIISEYNRADSPHPGVVQWMKATPATLQYLSVLTLGEIEKGILLLDEGKRRREIQQWFENNLPTRFAGRILAMDEDVASKWADSLRRCSNKGGLYLRSIRYLQRPLLRMTLRLSPAM
jgi:predicted nucleic acid-binding protein